MTADNLQVNFVTKVPYFFKHECHGHFEDNQHILYQELGTDIFQVCTKQTVRTRPRNLDNNEMESYNFKVDELGVVPGDPHPGDPRGKYFSGSPFPGEFFHGDPGEN